jgi:subtilisin family serine protease
MRKARVPTTTSAAKRLTFLFVIGVGALALLASLAVAAPFGAVTSGSASDDRPEAEGYIVVFEDSVKGVPALARRQAQERDAELNYIYDAAVKGYAADLTEAQAAALSRNPHVKYVERDGPIELFAQAVPTGFKRTWASEYPALAMLDEDDVEVNVDVAVIDTGVDREHPDLNLRVNSNPEATYAWVDCLNAAPLDSNPENDDCAAGGSTDGYGHGTHVAGIVGARDNAVGTVGMAPGARIWSAKIFEDDASGGPTGIISAGLAAFNWVYENSDQIEVVNMSFGAEADDSAVWKEAIGKSIDKGVVFIGAAGNSDADVANFIPPKLADVISVSAVTDYDGEPGRAAPPSCIDYGDDDRLATFSNWGTTIEIAAPGVCIESTLPVKGSAFGANYGPLSGTSMAAPHVAGAAALFASASNPASRGDVEAIRQTLLESGTSLWTDTSEDGAHEPMLSFLPPTPAARTTVSRDVARTEATLQGVVTHDGAPTSYWFEYGRTDQYGSSTPVTSVAAGQPKHLLAEATATALESDKPYHYRLVAKTSTGTHHGADRVVRTAGWAVQDVPNPSERVSELTGIACPAAEQCFAVGNTRKVGTALAGVIARRDGGTWTPQWTITTPLTKVSCGATTACVAIPSSGPNAQTWDGEAWSQTTLDVPVGMTSLTIADVSCASSSFCAAVGSYSTGGAKQAFVEHFNGTSWSLAAIPSFGSTGELTAVSCPAPSSCLASGASGTTPKALRWDGQAWSLLAEAPKRFSAGKLSCASSSSCIGIDNSLFNNGVLNGPLPWLWDGNGWKVIPFSPDPNKRQLSWRGVACPQVERCIAIGDLTQRGAGQRAIFQKWNGEAWAWQVVEGDASREAVGTSTAIACKSLGSCTGVAVDTLTSRALSYQESLKPLAGTGTATVTGSEQATVKAVVNPEGLQTTYRIEYVDDAAYQQTGWANALATPATSAGAGTADLAVDEDLTGLAPRTLYHYRAVAENGEGKSTGAGKTFSTWGSWSLVSTPNPKAQDKASLTDVSCWAAGSCRAVGYDEYQGRSVMESLSGGTWTLNAGGGSAGLKPAALSCPSSTYCTAVGEKQDGTPYTQRFLGSSAVPELAPATPTGGSALSLKGVSCSTKYTCTAVGSYTKEGKTRALIERFDEGTNAWAVQSPATTAVASLTDVSCPSTGECVAVGTVEGKPLAERWNGASWSAVSVPLPGGATGGALTDVSCASATSCVAIGTHGLSVPYAVTWDGFKWGLATTGLATNVGSAEDVSCSASNACTAVGKKEGKTFVQRFDGSSWSAQSSPNPEGKTPALAAVSCPSGTSCAAVGRSTFGSGESVTLGLGWNGTAWSLVSTPNPKAQDKASLTDVSCWAAGSCRAVGYDEYQGRSVMESLSGGTWTLNAGGGSAGLKPAALSCPSSTYCTAVGEKQDGTPYTQRFLGSSAVPELAPATPTGGSALSLKGVSCSTKYTCTAVGSYTKEGKTRALIERFDEGTNAWAVQSPATTAVASLTDVSCPSTGECVAVGTVEGKPLAERWNGASWSAVSVPLPGGATGGALTDVSCASATSCVAIGTHGLSVPYAVTWDGFKWGLATTGLATNVGSAEDVSCSASNACTAVGKKEGKTFVQRFDGSSWSAQSSPNPEGKTPALAAVSCPSGTSCAAVGRSTFGSGESVTLGLGYE